METINIRRVTRMNAAVVRQRKLSDKLEGVSRFLMVATVMVFMVMLQACGSDTSELASADLGADAETETGELVISLTDAEGDFLAYTVDVVSLKLKMENGAEVETLPANTRIDFAQYVEVTEFLSSATVPTGNYSGVEITLDYSNAEVSVEGAEGQSISASVSDASGADVTQLTVSLSLGDESDFKIARGVAAHITLDFDLEASNIVTIDGDVANVVPNPIIVADTLLEEPKPHRLRGLLAELDSENQSFKVSMRPFRVRRGEEKKFGDLEVKVSADTLFEVDQTAYNSELGLAALAEKSASTAIVVLGLLDREDRHFDAIEVYAGSSVPWGDKDLVKGNVISRTGDSIVVKGATLERRDGSVVFHDETSVNLLAETRVLKQGGAQSEYGLADISVGQRVVVLGELSDQDGENFNAELVRMKLTDMSGTVVSGSPLVLALQGVDRRPVNHFDFAGTGSVVEDDASAELYEVDSGALSLSNISAGDPIIITGHVKAFATAPTDFAALTIIDASNMPANISINFGDSNVGSEDAIEDLSDAGLQIDLSKSGDRHIMHRAGVETDLLELPSMPIIVPKHLNDEVQDSDEADASLEEEGRPVCNRHGLYAVVQGGSVVVFNSYEDFMSEVNEVLSAGKVVLGVHAHGHYEQAENTFEAVKMKVIFAE